MSESAPEPTGPATGQEGDGAPGAGTDPESQGTEGSLEQDPDQLSEQLAHWKAMSRKNERAARENAKAATELAELKQAQMTDLEKANHERDEAKRERDEARADHTRVMAAAAHNLPVEMIDYLGGGTEEEINDRAEAIGGSIETRALEMVEEILAKAGFTLTEGGGIQQVSGGNGNRSLGARPIESMRPGSAPASGGTPNTPDAWFRDLLTRKE